MKTIVGVFQTQSRARDVLYQLQAAGFDPQGVSIITADSRGPQDAEVPRSDRPAGESNETPGAVTDRLLVPGLSAIEGVVQPLPDPLVEDALDAQTRDTRVNLGSAPAPLPKDFEHTLAGLGLEREQIKDYAAQVANGGVLVIVQAADSASERRAREILQQDGAGNVAAASAH